MKYSSFYLMVLVLLLAGCSKEEASEYERTNVNFMEDIGGEISSQQWWRTAVTIKVNVVTSNPVKLWLLSSDQTATLYDYKEIKTSGIVVMTAPQGQGDVKLTYLCNNSTSTIEVPLTGKTEESVSIDTKKNNKAPKYSGTVPPESLCGSSIIGNKDARLRAQYYEFEIGQLLDFFSMMNISRINNDAKKIGLNCNYELISNGPFTITWVNGYKADQTSRILGYYYHSPGTYEDIQYVDLSETHKWDYIDGLAKVQYKLSKEVIADGYTFHENTWYDANFDLHDSYGSTFSENMDRVGDNAYNMQEVFNQNKDIIASLRGISFDIDVPEGMYIGFYLRSDEELYPAQWQRLQQMGIRPYTSRQFSFMGTCFSAEALNIDGLHRSCIIDEGEVIWMGMEDIVEGGDFDCNDVIFGVVTKLDINYMPDIITPYLIVHNSDLFPWTLAFEDVNRDADFDFNDAVIKLVPDYEKEQCCVTVMAAGSTEHMYLHYDGPDGDQVLGEIHELLGSKNSSDIINTTTTISSVPFVEVDCVPWPQGYTMANDAQRFYIEVKRGTCEDCTDIIALPQEPGMMPEALLVAGSWQWPKEGIQIYSAYSDFSRWAKDVTRTRFWDWYQSPRSDTFVTY